MGQKKKERQKKEKPLNKWTVKELREECLKMPDVHGVHGMNKDELIAVVKKAKGIVDTVTKKSEGVRAIKQRLTELRQKKDQEREQGATRARLNILRRRVSKLKKLTRRAA